MKSSREPRYSLRASVTISVLLTVAAVIALLRLRALDYQLDVLVPDTMYEVSVVQTFEGHGEDVELRTFLPSSDQRQRVLDERNQAADLTFTATDEGENRVGVWRGAHVQGRRSVSYAFKVLPTALRYDIPDALKLGAGAAGVAREHLEATEVIQSTAPEIVALAGELVPESGSVLRFLRGAFDRVQAFGYKPFKGTTDALTALRLGEASCNGRSRLLAALLRARGVPARLVGGLVLTQGSKRTSHQWLEAYVAGHWVPFDPTNAHFAELPHNYLPLYYGDEVLFRHSRDIGFNYRFTVDKHLVPRQALEQRKQVLGFWAVFSELGISLELLKIIIMIPLGAVVVVLFRNVLGLRTFGTFLPALIGAAAGNTGLGWGLLGFCATIALVSGVRRALTRLNLLHSPQLSILLTTVIGALLLTAATAGRLGVVGLAKLSLFPVALLAITSERFALMEEEEGRAEAWATLARTVVVVVFAYVVMNSLSLQILMLGFPELLLAVIALDIWIGRWIGLRLTEWLRFRVLIQGRAKEAG